MSSEERPEPDRAHRRHWYIWILAGAIGGAVFGPMGIAVGGFTEAMIVSLVNIHWVNLPRGLGPLLLFCLGTFIGMAIGSHWPSPTQIPFGEPGWGAGAVVGFVIALCDQVFVWVVFPEGAQTMDVAEVDADADDEGEFHSV